MSGPVQEDPYGPHMGPYGFKIGFLMKFLDDSASFLLEKLKNHVILTLIFDQKSRKYPKNLKKYPKIHGFLGFLGGDLCGDLDSDDFG